MGGFGTNVFVNVNVKGCVHPGGWFAWRGSRMKSSSLCRQVVFHISILQSSYLHIFHRGQCIHLQHECNHHPESGLLIHNCLEINQLTSCSFRDIINMASVPCGGWWELLSRCGGGEPRAVKVVQAEGRLGRTKALRCKSCCTVLIIHDKKTSVNILIYFSLGMSRR